MESAQEPKVSRRSPTPKVTAVSPHTLQPHVEEVRAAIARRAYELFEAGGWQHGHDREHWFRAETELLANAPAHLTESGDALNLGVTIEGFKKSEIKTSIEPRRIVVVGKRRVGAPAKKRTGIAYPELILSVIDLPVDISPKKAVIQFRTGMLTFELPKSKDAPVSTGTQAA